MSTRAGPDRTTRPQGKPAVATNVLFDLDGTIWDSYEGITRTVVHTLRQLGVEVPAESDLVGHVGPPLAVMLAELGVPAQRIDEARDVYRDRYRQRGEFECTVYPGAVDLLTELRAAGIALATATSKGVEPTRRMLAHFDLDHRFDVIAAADMSARDHSKADVIAAALAGLGDPPRSTVIMVGDRRYDIEGGRAHGLATVGVTWGYGTRAELVDAGADAVVDSFDELADVLATERAG